MWISRFKRYSLNSFSLKLKFWIDICYVTVLLHVCVVMPIKCLYDFFFLYIILLRTSQTMCGLMGSLPSWNTLVLIEYYKHQLTYVNKDSLFYNCYNVIVLMLLSVMRAPLDLLDFNALKRPSQIGSIFSGALSILHSWTPFKIKKIYLLLKMPSYSPEELTNSLIQTA